MPKLLIHLEGSAVLLVSIYFYYLTGFGWLLFILLLFAPDLSMLGYLINNRIGAVVYNIFHTYLSPLIFIALSILFSIQLLLAIGVIWTAHIGMDRTVGYGLKYHTNFKDTHLQRISSPS
jgi:cellulose synthase/poly-beta-1,6-N-acetylglucosamine synthase-like glycosyltransferase